MSKLLANEIANYGDNAPIDLKEGLNIPAGKPIQAAGVSGSSGMVLTSTGSSIAWTTPFDGNYNSLTNRPTIPAAQVNSDWNATSGISVILNKPTVPPLTSLTVNPAGTAALSFNASNGEFTYTPPDLSGYATETWVGSQGYLTSYAETDTLDSVTGRGASTTNNISVGDLSTSGLSSVANSLTLGNASGTFTILFSQSTGSSARIVNSIAASGLTIQGAYSGGSTFSEDIYLGTSGDSSRFKNLNPQADLSYDLGSSSAKWDNIYAGKLYYSNVFDDIGDLPSATDHHGMFAHVHATGKGYFAHGGVWLKLQDETSSVDELADVNTAAKQDGYVLKWDAATSNWKPAPDLVGTSNAGITLVDLSAQTAAAGTPSLSYSNTTGVFTYTPPDLSGYLTSETDPVFGASAAAGILPSNISNWDSAYGWGDHASAGYLTSIPSQIIQGNSKAEVIGSGTDDGEFKVTLQDSTYAGAGKISFRQYTSGSYNITELNPYTDGNISANSRLVLNNLTTTNAWSEIQFKLSGASSGTSTIKGNAGSSFQFYPVDGNVDFQISGAGTYTRLNHSIGGTLTAGGLTYPTSNGNNGDVLTSDGAGNVTWQASGGGGGGANVTISDTVPSGTPAAGDLWWESDSGRLKVYYTDVDTSQWVDASPPLAAQLSLSVTTNSAGSPALSYNSGTGVFTYTPPDLSNYDTAFAWGDHASAGYLTSLGDAAGVTTSKISNWDTAYGWGDHASAGYLTAQTSHSDVVVDGDFTTNGLLKRTSAGNYTSVTDNSSNWDTAYGWGNHASAGYSTYSSNQATDTTSNVTFGSVYSNGNVTAYSDVNLKEGITTISDALSKVTKLRGVSFVRKDTKQKGIGVIAQEIEKVLPEVVETTEYKSVAYGNIVGVLIESIKELKSEVDDLKKQLRGNE